MCDSNSNSNSNSLIFNNYIPFFSTSYYCNDYRKCRKCLGTGVIKNNIYILCRFCKNLTYNKCDKCIVGFEVTPFDICNRCEGLGHF